MKNEEDRIANADRVANVNRIAIASMGAILNSSFTILYSLRGHHDGSWRNSSRTSPRREGAAPPAAARLALRSVVGQGGAPVAFIRPAVPP